jgi:hypothetical protein
MQTAENKQQHPAALLLQGDPRVPSMDKAAELIDAALASVHKAKVAPSPLATTLADVDFGFAILASTAAISTAQLYADAAAAEAEEASTRPAALQLQQQQLQQCG